MRKPFASSPSDGVISPRASASDPAKGPRRRRTGLARLIGATGMVVLTATLLWLLTDDAFRVTADSVVIEGVNYADEDAIRDELRGLDRSPNVFRVRAGDFVRGMRSLPEISSASAVVTTPAKVSVRVEERRPIFTWSDGEQAWLVDASGMLFAPAPVGEAAAATPEDDEGGVARAALPIVEDDRLVKEPFSVGSRLPQDDFAVIRQLLAVTPELLGSRSASLQLSIDQVDGYVLRSDLGWQAVFGHYSPILQPRETVPRQVQCLAWLLGSRERRLVRVRLAVSADGCGTFTRTGSAG
ncbi:MAG: cell division protein FtsQ/DivIB [Chloroflexota bacterium]